ncbi:hypothetical protein BCR33DRAFT_737599 [Rhizoclosmatium globosum]|uniref:Uncharacterized protein n=1 Tax=Rhizoclosmatium globosum TaxID=329046 RepID=A0A1Y2CEB9_9FUNG|nr:hypothetical protein BCR33DRAFT_737599 [Rhizoclosmatium globosum]|eukprot:ORY45237.1 hypothetical protein BCR33DRAFT_737599 [Rhizoclosmatium globosum]
MNPYNLPDSSKEFKFNQDTPADTEINVFSSENLFSTATQSDRTRKKSLFDTLTRGRPIVKHESTPMSEELTKLVWKSSILAFGFILSWTPITLVRIIGLFPELHVPYWLQTLAPPCLASSGMWNPVTFFVIGFWDEIKVVFKSKA